MISKDRKKEDTKMREINEKIQLKNDEKLWNKAANGKITCEQTDSFDRQKKQGTRTNTRNREDKIN